MIWNRQAGNYRQLLFLLIPSFLLLLSACSRPVAQFAYNGSAKAGAVIQFDNQSEKADTYEWDFGDGNSSTEEAPKHRYKHSGIYAVRLKAIREGKSRVHRQQVVIAPPDRCLVE
ncbi:MAG: PKD domain-containing protein, partial [Sinomicrobium sp.]|nr:PKD domain-containing protein [Sinomicrobium sp.]